MLMLVIVLEGYRAGARARLRKVSFRRGSENCGHDEDVHQRNFKKEEQAQPHQLIPSKSRERPAHPHKQKNDGGDLCEEDRDVDQTEDPSARAIRYSRKMPAAKK